MAVDACDEVSSDGVDATKKRVFFSAFGLWTQVTCSEELFISLLSQITS